MRIDRLPPEPQPISLTMTQGELDALCRELAALPPQLAGPTIAHLRNGLWKFATPQTSEYPALDRMIQAERERNA